MVQGGHLTNGQPINGLFINSFHLLAHTHKSWVNPHFFLGNLNREIVKKKRLGRMFRNKKVRVEVTMGHKKSKLQNIETMNKLK